MNENEKVIETLSKCILNAAKQLSNQTGCDKTIPARILSNLGNGKYMVATHGNEYTAPCGIDMSFSVNDGVWVTLPCNHFGDRFISGKRV